MLLLFTSMIVFQPLKLNIDQAKADAIKGCLLNKLLKEDRFAMLFQETRDAAMKMINELLADFRTKLSLGWLCFLFFL